MLTSFTIKNIDTLKNYDDINNYIQELFCYLEKLSDIENEKTLDLQIINILEEVKKQITPTIINEYISDKQIEKIFDLNFLNFNKQAYSLKIHFLSNISDDKIEYFNKNNLKKFNSFLLLFFSNDEKNPLYLKLNSIQKKEILKCLKKTDENKKIKI